MPNVIAYLALFSWPLVAMLLFRLMPPLRAMIWTILGGYLFLPTRTGFDLPLLPAFDKTLIPSLTAAVLMWYAGRRQQDQERMLARRARQVAVLSGTAPARPASGGAPPMGPPRRAQQKPQPTQGQALSRIGLLSTLLVGVLLLLPFAIYGTNRDPVIFPTASLPGLKLYDALSMALSYAVMILPFLLGRRFLQRPEAHLELLRALAWGGLLYVPLMMIEARMSPQLNTWLYGFFSHSSFLQHIRGDHYRPIVFLEHGLRVAIFMAIACLAAAALQRIEPSWKWLLTTLAIGIGLFLSRSLGPVLIALALLPFVAFARPRQQAVVAALLAAMVLLYPMIRGAGLVPTDTLLSWAQDFDPDRAQSLQVRIDNEDNLLAKANEKPLFGWGAWGRSRVFSEEGADISITDGVWVILIGVGGWIGYIAHFGLLCLPLLARLKRRDTDAAALGLSLVVAANLIDMIPNSSMVPILWLVAGSLTGGLMRQRAPPAESAARTARRRTGSLRAG